MHELDLAAHLRFSLLLPKVLTAYVIVPIAMLRSWGWGYFGDFERRALDIPFGA